VISKALTYGKFGKLFCSIEHTTIDGQEKLNGLLLKKTADEFLIENSFESNAITNLSEQLDKGQHLFLVINNAQVLSKILTGNLDPEKSLAKAYPNLNAQDFYYETYKTPETTFIAICRKDVVDTIINTYTQSDYAIIGFSLGNLIVSQLNSLHTETVLQTSTSTIEYQSHQITAINSHQTNKLVDYNINGLKITNRTVLPLAGIISYYTQQSTTKTNFTEISEQLTTNFNQKRIFDVGLKSVLGTIFALLLLSFLFFTNYASKIRFYCEFNGIF